MCTISFFQQGDGMSISSIAVKASSKSAMEEFGLNWWNVYV